MLLHLFNIISDYSTSIKDINIEYHTKFEDYTLFDTFMLCGPTGEIYNYRKLADFSRQHDDIRDKKMRFVRELPKNYI